MHVARNFKRRDLVAEDVESSGEVLAALVYRFSVSCSVKNVGLSHKFSDINEQQESCAIAKMTAQCALYMGALKIFGAP